MEIKILDPKSPDGFKILQNVYSFNITNDPSGKKVIACGYTDSENPSGKVVQLPLGAVEVTDDFSTGKTMSEMSWKEKANFFDTDQDNSISVSFLTGGILISSLFIDPLDIEERSSDPKDIISLALKSGSSEIIFDSNSSESTPMLREYKNRLKKFVELFGLKSQGLTQEVSR